MLSWTLLSLRRLFVLSFLTGSLFVSGVVFAQNSTLPPKSREIAIGIYVVEGYAILRQEIEYHRELYRKLFPHIEFVAISVSVGNIRFDVNSDYNRSSVIRDLVSKLSAQVRPTDVVRQLFFSDHGSYNSRGLGLSSLEHLGYFSAHTISEDLKKILQPIQGQFSRDALLYFDSCTLVSKDPVQAVKSVRNLIRTLEIPEARIWASTTPVISEGNLTSHVTGSWNYLVLESRGELNLGFDIKFKNYLAEHILQVNGRSQKIHLIRETGLRAPISTIPRCQKYFQS